MDTFEEEYWLENYAVPESMDGIGNAKDHADYLKAYLKLEMIDVSSIIDLGFGYGQLFQKMMKAFIPYKACGIEPSCFAFNKIKVKRLKPVESTKLTLYNESLQEWCMRKEGPSVRFDLGLCNSVLQYISKRDLDVIVPVLAKRIKYLYLTVPTDVELDRQREELEFFDKYALRRSRDFYRKLLAPYFTNISSKLWESKYYFDEKSTLFTDLLYRS